MDQWRLSVPSAQCSTFESSRLAGTRAAIAITCAAWRPEWNGRAARRLRGALWGRGQVEQFALRSFALSLTLSLFLGTAGAALWDSGKRDVRRLEIAPSERRLQSDDELPCAPLASALIA